MTREEVIARAKPAHDQVCSCDPRYLMSCPKMAAAILALASQQQPDTARPLPTGDDFDARWRDIALRDPGHCTYPEAVPGFRRDLAALTRSEPAEGSGKPETISEPLRAAEPITPDDGLPDPIVHRDATTGGMIVHYPPAEPDVPPVATPVTVLAQLAAELRDAEIRPAGQRRRWWDPRTWRRR